MNANHSWRRIPCLQNQASMWWPSVPTSSHCWSRSCKCVQRRIICQVILLFTSKVRTCAQTMMRVIQSDILMQGPSFSMNSCMSNPSWIRSVSLVCLCVIMYLLIRFSPWSLPDEKLSNGNKVSCPFRTSVWQDINHDLSATFIFGQAFGYAAAKLLATQDPSKASQNPDNYAYFAEVQYARFEGGYCTNVL